MEEGTEGEKRKGERREAEAAYPEEGQTDTHTHTGQ